MTVVEEGRVLPAPATVRVLLVEDSPSDAAIVRALLRDTDKAVEVVWADCIAAARAVLASAAAFDCVLLDLGLPDAGGLETLANVQEAAPGVAIVVLTGLADESLGLEAVTAGAQDYLVKNVDSGASLLRSIRYAVERQHAVEVLNGMAAIVGAARARLQFQADLLDSAGQAIIAIDTHGAITYWNHAAEELYGWSAKDASGRLVRDVLVLESAGAIAAEVLTTVSSGATWSGDLWVQHRDGRRFAAFFSNTPILDANAGVVGVIGVSTDITERRALEDRLHQAQRLESLGQLAGGIAHDFNNLLTVILNYGDLIAEDSEGERREFAQRIVLAAQGGARLTRQLLTFARREPISVQPVDLNAVIAGVHDVLSRTLGSDIELDVLPGEVPAILADRGQIEQIVLNLVVNARDAMPNGGVLTIATTVTEIDAGVSGTDDLAPGTYVRLGVSDTGTGMSVEVASRVFEPFFTTKPKGVGSGLGLATVYGIVRDAGGSIGVESVEGVGTEICVLLPIASEVRLLDVASATSLHLAGRGETVLVVEDQPAVRAVTVDMLLRLGYVVREAAGAKDALAIAGREAIDLVLTDVVMPELSGPDLVREIRAARPSQRVLYMSGYTDGALGASRTLDHDVSLLHKPFDIGELLVAVSTALTDHPDRTAM